MTTVGKIIAQALKDAGVTGVGQTASGDDTQDAVESLVGMFSLWRADSLLKHALLPTAVALETELGALPAGYDEAIRYTLAERLTTVFQTPLRPDIAALARSSRRIVKRNNVVVPESTMPCHLPLGSVAYPWYGE